MRVVAGKYRGKKLISPNHDIRPTLDKVKQAIFTRLQFFVEGKSVLDLFSGSGALGIEALSRGASKVVFCDANYNSIKLIKENLKSLKDENFEVLQGDYKTCLNAFNSQFDLIILDPPYKSGYYDPALKIIAEKKLLSNDGIIVCERAKDELISNQDFNLECTKIYGTVAVDYFVNKS